MHAVVISAGTALGVSGLMFDGYVYLSLRQALVDEVTVQAQIAARHGAAALRQRDADPARRAAGDALADLQATAPILHAELRDAGGRLVAGHDANLPPSAAAALGRLAGADPKAGDSRAEFIGRHLVVREGVHEVMPEVVPELVRERVLAAASDRAPVASPDGASAAATPLLGSVRLVASLDPLYRRVAACVGITLLASLLSFLLAFMLVRRIRREVDGTERRLDELAYYDPVTQLRNRHAANEQIQRLIDTHGDGRPGFALLLLDLDDFKMVNDTFGHGVGDELLKAVAARLASGVQASDLLYRFGGDEFVMLAPRVDTREGMRRLGQTVLHALHEPFAIGRNEIRVRCSIGVAHYPADAADAATLLRSADTAMYVAKGMGKNICATFRQEMEQGARARMQLDNDLRRAIERDELRLQYQPIVDIERRRMVGVEALLRWRHPGRGEVPPAEFVPVAESSGLIVDIGQWVLRTACRQMKEWVDQGHPEFFVSVNVSARQVRRGVKEQVDAALAASGLDPRCLEVEITEHSMVEDIESNVVQLARLRDLGVQVAVDDFGTGLSSLAYLKRLPITKLKIDRAFVKDLPESSDDAAIAAAILSMARRLGLTVVAEGVETVAQRDLLWTQGCWLVQGYLYSRPLDADAVAELLERQAGGETLFQASSPSRPPDRPSTMLDTLSLRAVPA